MAAVMGRRVRRNDRAQRQQQYLAPLQEHQRTEANARSDELPPMGLASKIGARATVKKRTLMSVVKRHDDSTYVERGFQVRAGRPPGDRLCFDFVFGLVSRSWAGRNLVTGLKQDHLGLP